MLKNWLIYMSYVSDVAFWVLCAITLFNLHKHITPNELQLLSLIILSKRLSVEEINRFFADNKS